MADTGQIIGGYKLRGLLHTGRESQVWEVVEPTSNRHFAMKVLLPDLAYIILFLPMVVILAARPRGLFGRISA